MKVKLIGSIVAGAGVLTTLCSCGATTVSLKQFVKNVVNEKQWKKYVVYDNCTFTGKSKNEIAEEGFDYQAFEIKMIYDATDGYQFASQTGGDDITAKQAIRCYLRDISIPGMIEYWRIGELTDGSLDTRGRFVETKMNPYSMKGVFLYGYYLDVQYDNDGMPTKFRVDFSTSLDNYFDFTVTHTGDRHEVTPPPAPDLH